MATWLPSEDLQLCISYVRHSVDPLTGNKQKTDKLWEKVYADYSENWEIGHGESSKEARSQIAISSRFTKLRPILKSWGDALAYAQRNPQSGTNLHDELRKAQSWYVAQKKKEFTKFECWEVVKNHPYFRFIQTTTPPSSFPFEGTPPVCEMSPTIDLDENEEVLTPQSNPQGPSSPVRPMGVKAAKEARKKGKKGMTPTNEVRDEALKCMVANQKIWLSGQKSNDDSALALHKETLALQREDFNLRDLSEETRIMTMDMNALTPNTKRYFSKRKADILKKVDEAEEEDSTATFSNCYRPLNFSD